MSGAIISVRRLKAGLFSLLCASALFPAASAERGTPLDLSTDANTAWGRRPPDGRRLPAAAIGPGPVRSDPAHPYIPNGAGRQPTYRVADLSNPILQPWAREQMRKANERCSAATYPSSRERCWPSGIPGYLVDTRIVPLYIIQAPKEIVTLIQTDARMRHIYLDVPHSKTLKPSWYGESVGALRERRADRRHDRSQRQDLRRQLPHAAHGEDPRRRALEAPRQRQPRSRFSPPSMIPGAFTTPLVRHPALQARAPRADRGRALRREQ